MPFIPLITAGASIISGIAAHKQAKKAAQQQDQAFQQQQQLIDQQKKGAELAYGYANDYLPQGKELLNQSMNFWKPLVSGNRDAVSQFLAPEINQYNRALDSTANTLLTSGPRGGMLDKYTNLLFQKQGDLSNMFFGARKQGIGVLQDLGTIFNNAGSSALASASGQAASASSQLAGVQNLAYQQRQNANGAMAQIGSILGSVLPQIFNKAAWQGGGSGSSSNSAGSSSSFDWQNWVKKLGGA